MILRFFRIVQLGVKSLLLQKLRSGLTMLGIVFGVFSVIAMLAIGEGASNQAQQQVVALGATNIIVRSIKPIEDSSTNQNRNGPPRYGLLRSDFQRLKQTVGTIEKIIPVREIPREARNQKWTINARLVGCTADYLEVNHLGMAEGRFLSNFDEGDNVVVLSAGVHQALFPPHALRDPQDPNKRSVQIGGIPYTVIGVTERREASAGIGGSLTAQDYDKDLYIPIETLHVRLGDQIFTPKQGGFDSEQVELNQITLKVRSRDEVVATADLVRETLERFHPQKDFAVVVPLELLRQADQLRQIFNFVLGSIAAISLLVGGIGIMNIMLATVTERTREIGIRRALGARRRDIIEQFLTETVVLSGTGGILGIGMGLCTPYAFSVLRYLAMTLVFDSASSGPISDTAMLFKQMEPQVNLWSLPLAFGISVGIGVLFGLYPANSAARLDPIEALRHE